METSLVIKEISKNYNDVKMTNTIYKMHLKLRIL